MELSQGNRKEERGRSVATFGIGHSVEVAHITHTLNLAFDKLTNTLLKLYIVQLKLVQNLKKQLF